MPFTGYPFTGGRANNTPRRDQLAADVNALIAAANYLQSELNAGASGGGTPLSDTAPVALAATATAGTETAASRGNHVHPRTGLILTGDARLTDQRVPADLSVTDAKVAVSAAIAESKLALATDAAAGTGSRRTLGTVATSAAAGNDARIVGAVQASLLTAKGDLVAASAPNTAARLPVGANDQVLTADSAAPLGAKWAAVPGDGGAAVYGDRYYRTGRYYNSHPGMTTAAVAPSLDRVFYVPFVVGEGRTFDRIGVDITTAGAAGAVVRLGIYTDSGVLPNALVFDAGTVDSSTAGAKVAVFGQALSAGTIYWLAAVAQVATSTIRFFSAAGTTPWSLIGGLFAFVARSGYFQSNVTGALPANAAGTLTDATDAPVVALRAA